MPDGIAPVGETISPLLRFKFGKMGFVELATGPLLRAACGEIGPMGMVEGSPAVVVVPKRF